MKKQQNLSENYTLVTRVTSLVRDKNEFHPLRMYAT